ETWRLYEDLFKNGDKAFIKGWDKDLNTLLLFICSYDDIQATLFSAMVTAFVLESYKSLGSTTDMCSTSDDIRQSSSTLLSAHPSAVAVRINVLWFSSLIASVSTAFLAVLTKEWLAVLLEGRDDPHIGTRGRQLQHRHDNIRSWRLSQVLPFLPFLLHISFLLFFAGLVNFLWYINKTVAIVAAVLVCAMTSVY
ncbi:uncharacterized protein B0H18DRAFT_822427, partial [Fomitopsis serialis]|uniref:uncharacterized protein n=1 Tax=Fomitopsis serialis TaxID=139415 RepID=UPI0020074899